MAAEGKCELNPDKEKPVCTVPGNKLEKWLNKSMKIQMTDKRTLIGIFLCTDRDCNVILGSCEEYITHPVEEAKEEPRVLGLAMVPGQHIVSIHVDELRDA
ncbi:hypothetical protein CHS0354_006183 [Potamilus streckersoni]|uniref:Sm domain-containing protein n=1 Tax=Potamilus streckersoni TaxID=2493646 RepID=A0AAE0TG05_9BIVA|nr:hypothetical protein CHS0354_006183 [Potamilus streckersoni]